MVLLLSLCLLTRAVAIFYTAKDGAGVTPGLRKRRERDARQRSLLREQYQNNLRNLLDSSSSEDGSVTLFLFRLVQCMPFPRSIKPVDHARLVASFVYFPFPDLELLF